MKKLMKHKLLLVLLCAAAALLIAGAALLLYINGLDKALDSSKSDTVNITIETVRRQIPSAHCCRKRG